MNLLHDCTCLEQPRNFLFSRRCTGLAFLRQEDDGSGDDSTIKTKDERGTIIKCLVYIYSTGTRVVIVTEIMDGWTVMLLLLCFGYFLTGSSSCK